MANGTVHSSCTDSTQATARLIIVLFIARYQRAVFGDNNFGPSDRNDQTGQRGPPSKVVPNIPFGPNRNGPFDQSNRTFTIFGLHGKLPVFPEVSALGPVQTPNI